MPDGQESLTLKLHRAAAEVPESAWNACAGEEQPFLSRAFFCALEESGSASPETGWLAQHLALYDGEDRLLGLVPTYLKNHSYGEYVFDWSWADAYERAGGRYYPKLQASVPFTPVPGSRLLVRSDVPRSSVMRQLALGLIELARAHKVSSVHVTFCREDEWRVLAEVGFLQRLGYQFHWNNNGYRSFNDFLEALASRKRKAIRRERRNVAESGLELRTLIGNEIENRHWQDFHRFYLSTVDKKWANAYLTSDFFTRLGRELGDRVALVVAEDAGRPVAAALNLIGIDTLYGRNWGALAEYPFLHFEACYYRAIDLAIAKGLKRVEAGAQGQHKVQRGYLPTVTYSAHWFADPALEDAIADYLRRERIAVRREMDSILTESPYRRDC